LACTAWICPTRPSGWRWNASSGRRTATRMRQPRWQRARTRWRPIKPDPPKTVTSFSTFDCVIGGMSREPGARDEGLDRSGRAVAELASLAEAPQIGGHDRGHRTRLDTEPLQRAALVLGLRRNDIVGVKQANLVGRERRLWQELQEPGLEL